MQSAYIGYSNVCCSTARKFPILIRPRDPFIFVMVHLLASGRRLFRKAKFCLRYKVFNGRFILASFCLFFCTFLAFLHAVILPSVSGAYNDDCYLDEKKMNELRRLILVSARLMEKYNMTYWLDYGKSIHKIQCRLPSTCLATQLTKIDGRKANRQVKINRYQLSN